MEPLEDGSSVLHSTRLGAEPDTFALELGRHPGWTAGHEDERGVLLFDRSHLADVLRCRTYDAAVEALAGRSRWIRPKTLDDLMAEAEARARAYLEGDG